MSTRGAIVFVVDGTEKTIYNHADSYPGGLGCHMLAWLRGANLDDARRAAAALSLVDEGTEPSAEEWSRLAQYSDENVSSGRDWYSLLRETQGLPARILEAGVAGDGDGFPLDSLFCEWAYVVDFDARRFEVYKGFQDKPHQRGRFAGRAIPRDVGGQSSYYAVALVKDWPFSELAGLDVDAVMADVEEASS